MIVIVTNFCLKTFFYILYIFKYFYKQYIYFDYYLQKILFPALYHLFSIFSQQITCIRNNSSTKRTINLNIYTFRIYRGFSVWRLYAFSKVLMFANLYYIFSTNYSCMKYKFQYIAVGFREYNKYIGKTRQNFLNYADIIEQNTWKRNFATT